MAKVTFFLKKRLIKTIRMLILAHNSGHLFRTNLKNLYIFMQIKVSLILKCKMMFKILKRFAFSALILVYGVFSFSVPEYSAEYW